MTGTKERDLRKTGNSQFVALITDPADVEITPLEPMSKRDGQLLTVRLDTRSAPQSMLRVGIQELCRDCFLAEDQPSP